MPKPAATGKVKVYRFRLYDPTSEQFKISARMATHACIRRLHAELIKSTELEVEKKDVDADGMTEAVPKYRDIARTALDLGQCGAPVDPVPDRASAAAP